MKKYSWIRMVYLYLMTTIGLVVFIIGAVSLINIALKVYVFTNADADYYSRQPSAIYLNSSVKQAEELVTCDELSDDDKEIVSNWLVDYQAWQEEQENIDYRKSQRERQAAQAVAMILVGFPIYWLHWSLIKRDKKRDEESANA